MKKLLNTYFLAFTISLFPVAAYPQFESSLGEFWEDMLSRENVDASSMITDFMYISRRCNAAIVEYPEEGHSELLGLLAPVMAALSEGKLSEAEIIEMNTDNDFEVLKLLKSRKLVDFMQIVGEYADSIISEVDVPIFEIYEDLYRNSYATTGRYINDEVSEDLLVCFFAL